MVPSSPVPSVHERELADLQLHIAATGISTRPTWQRRLWAGAVVTAYVAAYLVLADGPEPAVRAVALFVQAAASVQAALSAHEARHGLLFQQAHLDRGAGRALLTLLNGFSHSRWSEQHERVHRFAGDGLVDPLSRPSTSRWLAGWRALLLSWQLKLDSLEHLRAHGAKASAEWVMLAAHAALWVAPAWPLGVAEAALNYAALQTLIGPALALLGQLAQADLRRTPPLPPRLRVALSAMEGPEGLLLDLLLGGFNNAVLHLLVPDVAPTRLSRARPVLRAWCERRGLQVHRQSMTQTLRRLLGRP